MKKKLSIKQILDVCLNNKYILLTHSFGKMAVNCKVAQKAVKKGIKLSKLTVFITAEGCSLNEYITYKAPFIK